MTPKQKIGFMVVSALLAACFFTFMLFRTELARIRATEIIPAEKPAVNLSNSKKY